MVIWKQCIPIGKDITIDFRGPGELLHFGLDPHGVPSIWFTTDPKQPTKIERKFRIIDTGHPFNPEGLKYVGTVTADPYVWHLFEIKNEHAADRKAG